MENFEEVLKKLVIVPQYLKVFTVQDYWDKKNNGKRTPDIPTRKRPPVYRKKQSVVITPAGEFENLHEAGKHYSVRDTTVRCWIKDGKDGFRYKD